MLHSRDIQRSSSLRGQFQQPSQMSSHSFHDHLMKPALVNDNIKAEAYADNEDAYTSSIVDQHFMSQEDISFINNLQQNNNNKLRHRQQHQQQPLVIPQGQVPREILVMTVDIGNGESGKIRVYEEDDPQALAVAFVSKHNLPTAIVDILKENIDQNVQQIRLNNSDKQAVNVSSQQQAAQRRQPPIRQLKQQQTTAVFPQQSQSVKNATSSISNTYQSQQKQYYQTLDGTRSSYSTKASALSHKQQQFSNSQRFEKPANLTESRSHRNHDSSSGYNNLFNSQGLSSNNINTQKLNQSFQGGTSKQSKATKETVSAKKRANRSFDMGKQPLNVHERLFAQAKIKSKSQIKCKGSAADVIEEQQQPKRIGRSSSEINYGVRLYQRGVKQLEERKKTLEKRRIEELSQIDSKCTYQPQINEISSLITTNLRNEPIGEFMQKVAREQREKKERARSERIQAEVNRCSFQPIINQISEQIDKEKTALLMSQQIEPASNTNNNGFPRHHQLYKDSKQKAERLQQLESQIKEETACSFHPIINEFSRVLMHDISFFERQQRFSSKENYNPYQQSLNTAGTNNQALSLIDPTTGQELFKPMVGRPPKNQQRKAANSLGAGEHLYEQSRIQQQHLIEMKLREEEECRIIASSVVASELSSKIVDSRKKQRLSEIFTQLDSDQDGEISAKAIDISYLDPVILETFSPLLCEMEELDQSLTREEFIQAADRLVQGLSVEEKNRIFAVKRKPSTEVSFDFKPKINQNSMKLAQYKKPYGTPAVYDVFINEKQRFQEKMRIMKEQQDQSQVDDCTFAPNIQSLGYQTQSFTNSFTNVQDRANRSNGFRNTLEEAEKLFRSQLAEKSKQMQLNRYTSQQQNRHDDQQQYQQQLQYEEDQQGYYGIARDDYQAFNQQHHASLGVRAAPEQQLRRANDEQHLNEEYEEEDNEEEDERINESDLYAPPTFAE